MKLSSMVAVGVLAIMVLPVGASAALYSFTNIADNSGKFQQFRDPSISANGTVAFYAELDRGGTGIFTGSGGPTTTIASSEGEFADFILFPAINADGTVAFNAQLDLGGFGVFTGDGGPTTTIADASGLFSGFEGLAISNSGTVVFRGNLDDGGEGVFIGSRGATPTIANTAGPFRAFGIHPSINATDTVAFGAFRDGFDMAKGGGVFIGNGGPTSTIATDDSPLFRGVLTPMINDAETVAFFAFLDGGPDEGLFTSTAIGGPFRLIEPVADTTGPYDNIGGPSLNNDGTVAFFAELDAGGRGIFTGNDPVADKVIQTDDELFGAQVVSVDFFRGLNDDGALAFRYVLDDGRLGVAVASVVPEPASWALWTFALVAIAGFLMPRSASAAARAGPLVVGLLLFAPGSTRAGTVIPVDVPATGTELTELVLPTPIGVDISGGFNPLTYQFTDGQFLLIEAGFRPVTLEFRLNLFTSGQGQVQAPAVFRLLDIDGQTTHSDSIQLGGLGDEFVASAAITVNVFDDRVLHGVELDLDPRELQGQSDPGTVTGGTVQLSVTGFGRLRVKVDPSADFDEDGDVDGDDLAKWTTGYGTTGTDIRVRGDANLDHVVDGADFLIWQRQLGSITPKASRGVPAPGAKESTPVPEPDARRLCLVAAVLVACSVVGRQSFATQR